MTQREKSIRRVETERFAPLNRENLQIPVYNKTPADKNQRVFFIYYVRPANLKVFCPLNECPQKRKNKAGSSILVFIPNGIFIAIIFS